MGKGAKRRATSARPRYDGVWHESGAESRTTKARSDSAPGRIWRDEWFLGFSLATTAVFAFSGESLYARLDNPFWLAFVFAWLFGTVMGSALNVVRHADHVAEILGEPYGTLVLTLCVTAIEVMSITAVMLHGDNNPTLVRDVVRHRHDHPGRHGRRVAARRRLAP